MTPTPYGSDVDEHDLNGVALQRLQAPSSSERVRFVALGDSHDAYDELADAVAAINRVPDVAFVAHAGDISDYGLAQELEWAARAMSGLRPPTLVAIGNHDALNDGKTIYRNLYGPFDFSFRYGRYKFVSFNSNALEFPGAAPDRAWLEAQLSDLEGADSAVLVTHENLQAPDTPAGSNDAAFYEHLLLTYPLRLIVHGHLDAFDFSAWHGVPKLQLGTFRITHRFSIVSLSPEQVAVQSCDTQGCLPQLTQSLERRAADGDASP